MRVYPLLPSTGLSIQDRYFWMVYRPSRTFLNQVGINLCFEGNLPALIGIGLMYVLQKQIPAAPICSDGPGVVGGRLGFWQLSLTSSLPSTRVFRGVYLRFWSFRCNRRSQKFSLKLIIRWKFQPSILFRTQKWAGAIQPWVKMIKPLTGQICYFTGWSF